MSQTTMTAEECRDAGRVQCRQTGRRGAVVWVRDGLPVVAWDGAAVPVAVPAGDLVAVRRVPVMIVKHRDGTEKTYFGYES